MLSSVGLDCFTIPSFGGGQAQRKSFFFMSLPTLRRAVLIRRLIPSALGARLSRCCTPRKAVANCRLYFARPGLWAEYGLLSYCGMENEPCTRCNCLPACRKECAYTLSDSLSCRFYPTAMGCHGVERDVSPYQLASIKVLPLQVAGGLNLPPSWICQYRSIPVPISPPPPV